MLLTLGRVAVALAAAAVAVLAVRSALRTIVVPRGIPDRFARFVFRVLDAPTAWQAARASSPRELDRSGHPETPVVCGRAPDRSERNLAGLGRLVR
jgi:hypothetical protein